MLAFLPPRALALFVFRTGEKWFSLGVWTNNLERIFSFQGILGRFPPTHALTCTVLNENGDGDDDYDDEFHKYAENSMVNHEVLLGSRSSSSRLLRRPRL